MPPVLVPTCSAPEPSTAPRAVPVQTLTTWPLRRPAVIHALASAGDADTRRTLYRLIEIGFLPGETVRIVARAGGRGGPVAVRVGGSTFALRAHEAALLCVGAPA